MSRIVALGLLALITFAFAPRPMNRAPDGPTQFDRSELSLESIGEVPDLPYQDFTNEDPNLDKNLSSWPSAAERIDAAALQDAFYADHLGPPPFPEPEDTRPKPEPTYPSYRP